MNYFVFSPKSLTGTPAARYVLGIYDADIAQARAVNSQTQDLLGATLDVLTKTYPDLANDLNLLVEQAKYAGHAEGHIQDAVAVRADFFTALPWAVKQEMNKDVPPPLVGN
jgi:hypothetical protein